MIEVTPTSVTWSYGRQYEGGPFEAACPVDPGCMWEPGLPKDWVPPEGADPHRAAERAIRKVISDHIASHAAA